MKEKLREDGPPSADCLLSSRGPWLPPPPVLGSSVQTALVEAGLFLLNAQLAAMFRGGSNTDVDEPR
ncbi:hypothetical protein CORC01_07880 [Colletotrichum orchidophilum]|uniref:Uncharacterized protein n=1 Tax=Colletotrichum orchidophilum TaxID=1209926 RepID=A0A1G4B5Q7_9PEZI|nr:uncharacterized protein CORC01_07880 [Colletotrichum orchidophilum]OHE96734.1 hypothetical protein CORC01_07880 [Colletotrichum orchidophilum]